MGGHGYFEAERGEEGGSGGLGRIRDENVGKDTVDVVISDMCEPWPLRAGQWANGIKQPYHRLMNVSGLRTRDHAHSMVTLLAPSHTQRLGLIMGLGCRIYVSPPCFSVSMC